MMEVVWSKSMIMVTSISSFPFTDRCSLFSHEKRNVLRFEVVNISRHSMVSSSLPARVPMIFSRIADAGNIKEYTILMLTFTVTWGTQQNLRNESKGPLAPRLSTFRPPKFSTWILYQLSMLRATLSKQLPCRDFTRLICGIAVLPYCEIYQIFSHEIVENKRLETNCLLSVTTYCAIYCHHWLTRHLAKSVTVSILHLN